MALQCELDLLNQTPSIAFELSFRHKRHARLTPAQVCPLLHVTHHRKPRTKRLISASTIAIPATVAHVELTTTRAGGREHCAEHRINTPPRTVQIFIAPEPLPGPSQSAKRGSLFVISAAPNATAG